MGRNTGNLLRRNKKLLKEHVEFHRFLAKFLVLLCDVVKVTNIVLFIIDIDILFLEPLLIYNNRGKFLAIQIPFTLLEKIGMTMTLS